MSFVVLWRGRNVIMLCIWAGRKTLVHRAAGNFPAIFIHLTDFYKLPKSLQRTIQNQTTRKLALPNHFKGISKVSYMFISMTITRKYHRTLMLLAKF